MPEMGVLPPALMLTTVRMVAPAPAQPPHSPATAFPMPCTPGHVCSSFHSPKRGSLVREG